jgi:hypothetical protein
LGQEPARLLGEVEQDRSRLKDGDRLAVRSFVVYYDGHLVVGTYLEELFVELLSGRYVDGHQGVEKVRFFQEDGYFLAVGRWPVVKIYRLRHSVSLLMVRSVPQGIVPSLSCLRARDHHSMFMWVSRRNEK